MKFKPLVLPPDYLVQVPIQLVSHQGRLFAGVVIPHNSPDARQQRKELLVAEVEEVR